MLLLAADTSGPQGSLALSQADSEGRIHLVEMVGLTGGAFSAELVPQIASLLGRHSFSKQQIQAFVVASGPGSFTGLRVGLAAIKGLAEVLKKPIAAVSLLEAVALDAHRDGNILSALDAGRGQVYVGEYRVQLNDAEQLREDLLDPDELLTCLRSTPPALFVTPDENVSRLVCDAGLPAQKVERPHSDRLAEIGWLKLQRGQTVAPEQLEANYIRRSDAELKK